MELKREKKYIDIWNCLTVKLFYNGEKIMNNKELLSSFNKCKRKSQIYRLIRHTPVINKKIALNKYGNKPILSISDGREILKKAVIEGKPYMAARFGTTEGATFVKYWETRLKYGDDFSLFPQKELDMICCYSGFFPNSKKYIWKWAELETEACKDLDLLGTMNFLNEEWVVETFCKNAQLMPNAGLASGRTGWASVLEGRKVLVVHPFTETIERQYFNNREKIFPGTNALPLFDLKCVKAVQTIADQEDERFKTWFEALDYMTVEISKQDFDVCLLGCGAYGFQLASRVKRMGKIAIHMGGSLQTLFGICGGRWDKKYSELYNEYWVYPSMNETPKGFEKVEGGCYWKNDK